MKLEQLIQIQQSVPPSIQATLNWSAIGAAIWSAIMAFVGAAQIPLAVLASALSCLWLALQIYALWRRK